MLQQNLHQHHKLGATTTCPHCNNIISHKNNISDIYSDNKKLAEFLEIPEEWIWPPDNKATHIHKTGKEK